MNGKTLNRKWNVNAKHALYRATGDWYHQLRDFPGALFDRCGYVLFDSERDFRECSYLDIGQDVHVPKGISAIPSYVRVVPRHPAHLPLLAEEVPDSRLYPEGATCTVSVNAYERNRAAREACVDHYGLLCIVCGFDFVRTYGELGAGYIHVHHVRSLSEVNASYEVDPIRDLRPVCPNCHAMLHRESPTLSVDELRERMR